MGKGLKAGSLAVVTGASSGLGVDFARSLARRKVDVILTARREDRLKEVAAEVSGRFGVTAHVLPHDLGSPEAAEGLAAKIDERGLAPNILVNNAGFGLNGPFIEQPWDTLATMIGVNVLALARLAHLYGGRFAAGGEGYILNVASFVAIQPCPTLAVYAGTKGFALGFSRSLREELKSQGVRVTALCPGFTETEFFDRADFEQSRGMKRLMLKSAAVAEAGVRGMLRGKDMVIPGVLWRLNYWLVSSVPRWMAMGVTKNLVAPSPESEAEPNA